MIVREPIFAVLAGGFAVSAVILAYYLVRGFRESRMPMRLTYPFPKRFAADGHEHGYAYRDRHTVTFWVEAGFNLMAVAIAIGMAVLLVSLP